MTDRREIRQQVWNELRSQAKPDSRFHLDFNEFIPDFVGSDLAANELYVTDLYREAQTLFITPDNCLEQVRAQAVRDGKVQVVSTYGIRRGLVLLRPEDVPPGMEPYAPLLDVLETFGRYITLSELRDRRYHFDLMITGASAISLSGVRFGKGHGYFDVEYGMFRAIGVVDATTPVVGIVHDCQLVNEELEPSPFDTIVDHIFTPTRVIHVMAQAEKPSGIFWDKLAPGMMDEIPPLQELYEVEEQWQVTRGGMPMLNKS